MREKYESLALADLKEIAKSRGIKGVSTMKKADVVEAMLAEDEKSKINPEKLSSDLDSGMEVGGILEVMPDGYGFIRSANYLPGENDVYVAPSQIRKFGLKTGDIITGNTRVKTQGEKFSALLYVKKINGLHPAELEHRISFEDLTPIFPDERLKMETKGASIAMRIMDLISPVGKGQRGMIVSPPKAGKTTLLKEVAKSIKTNNPDMHLIILLIDERPEEVTDIREAIEGPNVEVIYSTFDELPEHHKRVSEMVIERAKRLVELKKDVTILLDSITRLTRAYNLPARYVLHTVGPIVGRWVTWKDRRELAACYRSCLALAAEHGLRSVAFCCISTGEFHFPNQEAAEIAVRTVREFLEQQTTSVERVIFNVFKDLDAAIYRRLLGPD